MPAPASAALSSARSGRRPTPLERLKEALDLAVPARRVGRGEDLAGADPLELVPKGEGAVGVAVVAHHRLGRAEPQPREVLDRPAHEGRRGLGALVGMLLDVGIARAVVDAGVQEGVAQLGAPPAALGRAPANAMTGSLKAREPGRVHVKQGAGTRPLIAPDRLPRARGVPRDPVAAKDLPDRRAGAADDSGQPARAQPGLAAGAQDRLLLGGAHAPGLAPRA